MIKKRHLEKMVFYVLKINTTLTSRMGQDTSCREKNMKKDTKHIYRTANSSDLLTQCFLPFPVKNSKEFIKSIASTKKKSIASQAPPLEILIP